jgi:hypothetical protein
MTISRRARSLPPHDKSREKPPAGLAAVIALLGLLSAGSGRVAEADAIGDGSGE